MKINEMQKEAMYRLALKKAIHKETIIPRELLRDLPTEKLEELYKRKDEITKTS